jgi:hypothetical protein
MFGQTRLTELQARKELLLFEARVERELLALEAQNVAHALRWIEPVHRAWLHIKPLAWLAAPVAGFYLARRGRSVWSWASRLVNVGRWASRILSVWRLSV